MENSKTTGAKAVKDATRWNSVTLGDSVYTVERAPELLAKIDLSLITCTNAYDKLAHKLQCRNCKMFFEKTSVNEYVPNHRVIDFQRNLGVRIEGARYSTASYLYTNSPICTFCAQLFADIGRQKILPKPTKRGSTSMDSLTLSKSESNFNPNHASASLDDVSVGESVATFHSTSTASSFGKSLAHKNNNSADNNVETVVNTKNGLKLEIKTEIKRTNIAVDKRTYQSSEVDNMDSANAITVPYHVMSRTRREADPWWEIDLGRPYHVHSLAFDIKAQKAQNTEAIVFLLSKPYGFEEPFIDKIARKSLLKQEFVVEEALEQKQTKRIEWVLPPGQQPVAVRVQLRGIHTLQLNEFKLFLGDNYVASDEAANLKVTKDSYATVSPTKIKNSLESMLSYSKKREKTSANLKKMIKTKIDNSRLAVEHTMGSLETNVHRAYAKQEAWKLHSRSFVDRYSPDEIHDLFHVIFKPCVIEGCKAEGRKTPFNCLPFGVKYKDESSLQFPEESLLDEGLTLHYPRAELQDVHQRVRAMLLMIQSFGTHPKPSWVGELQWNTTISKLAMDPNEQLGSLKDVFSAMEDHWLECTRTYRDKHGVPRKNRKNPAEERGVSWSQFLIIFSLFMDKHTDKIPELVFNVTTLLTLPAKNQTRDNTPYASCPGTADDQNNTARSNRTSSTAGLQMSRRGGLEGSKIGSVVQQLKPSIVTSPDGTQAALIPYKGSLTLVEGASIAEYGSIGFAGGVVPNASPQETPLLFRSRDPSIPPMDTRFAEYKLSKFTKRVNSEFVFPKELTLEFTDMLLKDQKERAAGKRKDVPTRRPKVEGEDDDESVGKLSFMAGSTELPPIVPSFDEVHEEKETKIAISPDDYGAPRTCTLCQKRYAYSATHFKVLFKHIITLRRHWDPALVSADIQMLEQGTSMFNLVTVCGFCNQLFHPDFEGGIFFPIRNDKSKKPRKPIVPNADDGSVRENPFFDGRYPVPIPVGSFFKEISTGDRRELARTAIQVAENIRIQKAEDEERVRNSDALAASLSPNNSVGEGGFM